MGSVPTIRQVIITSNYYKQLWQFHVETEYNHCGVEKSHGNGILRNES